MDGFRHISRNHSYFAFGFIFSLLLSGCNTAPYGGPPPAQPLAGTPASPSPTGPGSVYAQQQTNPQFLALQTRVKQLDTNNRELTTQLAQAQQQAQAFRERTELLGQQLQAASEQNRQLLAASQAYANQAIGLQASMREFQDSIQSRGAARITANNSVQNRAGGLQIAGANVVTDGDLIRIRIPADQLFVAGSVQPSATSANLLDQVGNALVRQYPRQRVGIEGHTDSSPNVGGYQSAFQLASAQAQAVLNQLVHRSGVPAQQLFVLAHGANHPLADNQTAAGRYENRRIEIVVYPETY